MATNRWYYFTEQLSHSSHLVHMKHNSINHQPPQQNAFQTKLMILDHYGIEADSNKLNKNGNSQKKKTKKKQQSLICTASIIRVGLIFPNGIKLAFGDSQEWEKYIAVVKGTVDQSPSISQATVAIGIEDNNTMELIDQISRTANIGTNKRSITYNKGKK